MHISSRMKPWATMCAELPPKGNVNRPSIKLPLSIQPIHESYHWSARLRLLQDLHAVPQGRHLLSLHEFKIVQAWRTLRYLITTLALDGRAACRHAANFSIFSPVYTSGSSSSLRVDFLNVCLIKVSLPSPLLCLKLPT